MENKVSPERIEYILDNSDIDVKTLFDKVTVVTCKLPNGFVLVESSGAVDKRNYDLVMGKGVCMKKIEDKIWELEGYALANSIINNKASEKWWN